MFTRCPECLSAHALSAALLARSSGRVQCANCKHQFNALTSLFDDWPESGESAPVFDDSAAQPVVGSIILPAPDETGTREVSSTPQSNQKRWFWPVMLGLLLLVTVANLAWTFRTQLMRYPFISNSLQAAGLVDQEVIQTYRDTTAIHLVSRDLHQHPNLAGMLALSATFVSRGHEPQPYPSIELTLIDAGNNAVARRIFTPDEYLPGGKDPINGLAPGVHVPVLLEFAEPGGNVSGFSLEFH